MSRINIEVDNYYMENQALTFIQRLKRDCRLKLKIASRHKIHYAFMLPFALIFFLFTILPVTISIVFGFTSFNMLEIPQWVGFDNYYRLFLNDSIFITALKNTLILACVTGPLGYIMGFMFAWFLNELTRAVRVIFTIVFYAPSISGGIYIILQYIFSGDAQGLVNSVLLNFNLVNKPIQFLQEPAWMMFLCILIILWMSLGTNFLIFIAGFQGLDRQYYEAAAIDGIRNRWQELWFITLPLLKSQLLLNAVLSISSAFGVGAVTTALFGFPSKDYAVHTVINHMTDYGTTRYEMGYASAIATVLFLMMLLANTVIKKFLKRIGE